MLKAFAKCWKIPEIRKRILITLGFLVLCRIAQNVPCPGVDTDALTLLFDKVNNSAGGQAAKLFNLFSGGAMQKFAIAALGIMPYITASIIMSLMGPVFPVIEKWKREGESGYARINQMTRYLTLIICAVQGWMFAMAMENPASILGQDFGINPVQNPGIPFRITTVIILTCGTMILMWFGEKITEKGVGNGASIIITIGILDLLPSAFGSLWGKMTTDVAEQQLSPVHILILIGMFVIVTGATVALSLGVRKVPIQYARARAGRTGADSGAGQGSFFPLKVNYANVMPIIFASALLMFPPMIFPFLAEKLGWTWLNNVSVFIGQGWGYYIFYATLVIVFCFFWVANQFNPVKIAEDLKRQSAYVPGYRPGKETADHIDFVMTRVTTFGAICLCALALLPNFITDNLNLEFTIASFFGGTSLLIMVGVVLDTVRQLEAHLLTHGGYESFLSTGRMKKKKEISTPGSSPTM